MLRDFDHPNNVNFTIDLFNSVKEVVGCLVVISYNTLLPPFDETPDDIKILYDSRVPHMRETYYLMI